DEESRIARLVIGREPDHFAPVLKGQSDSLALENGLLRTGGDHEENRFDAIEWNVVQDAGARVERYVARHQIHVSKHPALHLSIEEVNDPAPLALHERAAEEVFAVSELRAHHDGRLARFAAEDGRHVGARRVPPSARLDIRSV